MRNAPVISSGKTLATQRVSVCRGVRACARCALRHGACSGSLKCASGSGSQILPSVQCCNFDSLLSPAPPPQPRRPRGFLSLAPFQAAHLTDYLSNYNNSNIVITAIEEKPCFQCRGARTQRSLSSLSPFGGFGKLRITDLLGSLSHPFSTVTDLPPPFLQEGCEKDTQPWKSQWRACGVLLVLSVKAEPTRWAPTSVLLLGFYARTHTHKPQGSSSGFIRQAGLCDGLKAPRWPISRALKPPQSPVSLRVFAPSSPPSSVTRPFRASVAESRNSVEIGFGCVFGFLFYKVNSLLDWEDLTCVGFNP